MSIVIYDLDGTLVETKLANREAYIMAGVTPPDNFNTIPWQEWTTKEIHTLKNINLEKTMPEYARELPLLQIARSTKSIVLSNVSDAALKIVAGIFDLSRLTVANKMTPTDKVLFLKNASYTGVYVDDSIETCKLVKATTGWSVMLAVTEGNNQYITTDLGA